MAGQYKILVTSTKAYGEAVSVHTTVLEFEEREHADIAYQKLSESQQNLSFGMGIHQASTKLY